MGERIYIYNKLTKTLHIKNFCSAGSEIDNELFERKKEQALQRAVKKSKN